MGRFALTFQSVQSTESILQNVSVANLNTIGMVADFIATKRNKKTDTSTNEELFRVLEDEFEEISEVFNEGAELAPSQHIGDEYTWLEEEIADVLIVCLTWLHHKNCNINSLVRKKMLYNLNRKD